MPGSRALETRSLTTPLAMQEQVMSPTMLPVMEGETTGPSYGAVPTPPGLRQPESGGQLVAGSGLEQLQDAAEGGAVEPSLTDPVTVTEVGQAVVADPAVPSSSDVPRASLTPTVAEPLATESVAQRIEAEGLKFSPPEDFPDTHEHVTQGNSSMWFLRLSEFVQRRVNQAGAIMTPILENRQPRTPSLSTPPRAPRLFSPDAEQAMQQWTRRAPHLYPADVRAAPTESSSGSLTQEQMMAEVQKQVKMELKAHEDEKVALRSENLQLKSMLERVLMEVQTRGLDERRGHDDRGNSAVPVGGAVPGDSGVREGNPAELRHHSEALGEDPLAKQPGPAPQPRSSERLSAPPGAQGACGGRSGDLLGVLGGAPQRVPEAGGLGLSGPTSTIPGAGDGGGLGAGSSATRARDDPMGALMRGMAQLQSAMTESLALRSKDEVVKPGQSELPKLPDLSANSAIDVGDWLHGLQNHMGDLSGNSGMWWKEVLACLSRYYEAYLSASHVGKLSLRSADYETDFLKDARWLRLDKRAASMILASIPEAVKSDILAARLAGTLPMLARIVVLYRPGSVAERQQILQALESPTTARSSTEAVNELRKWSRWMARALDMGLQPPDPSVLIKGLDGMTKSVLNDHSDVAFRISMLRYNLEVDTRPTIKGAQDLQQALLSELEQVAFRTRPGGSAGASVKAVTLPSPPPPVKAPQPTGGGDGSPRKQKPPCKFYLTEKGCSKGGACSFSHNFTRKERAGRCWTCGSTLHQQTTCPTKQDGGSPTDKSKAGAPKAPAQPQVAAVTAEQHSAPLPSADTTGTTTSMASSNVSTASTSPALPEGDLKELLKEASAMLKEIRQLKMLSLSQVEQRAKELGCDPLEGRTGLLDSGASHPYREATDEELDAAHRVQVQLADGREVCLAQNASGTLLVQASKSGASSGPIVPLGALVQDLGCQVSWTRRGGLTIRHPEHGIIKPTIVGRCPVVAETQALDLIYEIECEKLRELRSATKANAKSLWMWATDKPWAQHLEMFVREGGRAHQLQAMNAMGSPFLGWSELDKSLASEGIDLGDKAGWTYLRALPGSRQRRKRLMSMPWVVHLFSGPGHAVDPLFRELDDGRVLVQIDINRSKSEDLGMIAGAYRCLLWGAATGRIDGFFGSPPVKPELVQKMMWLVTVAKAARAEHGGHPVFAMFEGEKVMKLLRGTNVERWKAVAGSWEKFVEATCLEEIGESIVTNLAFDGVPPAATERGSSRWTFEFKEALVQAVRLWGREPEALQVAKWVKKLDIKDGDFMESLSDKELAMWRAHVRNNHLPYNRRCQTCVRSSGVGKIHKRIKHPSAYCLSLDVAGPFRHKAADPNHKDYRYLLVGAYIMPKQANEPQVPQANEPQVPQANEPQVPQADEPQVPQADEPQVPQADEPQVPQAGGLVSMLDDSGLDVCDDGRGVGPVPLEDEQDPMEESLERHVRGGVEGGDDLRGLSQEEFERIFNEVGAEMEFVTVYLVRPLRTRTSAEVTAATQELILRLKSEGLQVSRVHSDRARELRVEPLRRWLLEHGVLVTYTEGLAVKWTKSSVKRLLSAAKLGNENWAVAANYATQEQFERVLKGSSSMLPFGTKVHVRSKVYGTGGRYDLDSRWKAGQYVGPSLEVRGGHVIRFDNGAFMTSSHLRPYLVDSDQIVDLEEYEVRLPNPERRLRTKTKAEAAAEHDCQEVNTTVDPDHPAELYAKDLLEEEILYAEQMETLAMMLPTTTATPKRFGPQGQTQKVWMAGAFVHGGIAGVKNATTSFSYSTRAFVRYVKQLEPTHKFNSLAVTVDTEAKQHVDAHNVGMNLIAGLSRFKGGGVEVEEPGGAKLLELDGANTHQVFNPKYRHSTRPWSGGSRVVLVAYSVRDSGKLPQDKIDLLHSFGFDWEPHLSKPLVEGEAPRIGAIKVGLLETGSHAVAPEQPRDSSDQVGEDFVPDAVAPEQHRDSSDQVGDVLYEGKVRKWGDPDVLSHLSQDLEVAIQDLEDRAARLRDLLEEEEILNEEYRRLGDSTHNSCLFDGRQGSGWCFPG